MRYSILFVVIFMMACTNSEIVSEDVLSEREMIEILSDVHLSDAFVESKRIEDVDSMFSFKNVYFNEVLEKHNVSKAYFETSYDYYSSDLNRFVALYDSVIVALSKREAEL